MNNVKQRKEPIMATNKNYNEIMAKDFTVDELTKLTPDEYVVACWHEAGLAIVNLINDKYINNTFIIIKTMFEASYRS